ncbi:hypothetical protein ACUOCP_10050, partial [Escherichia sp. R-CC3]
MTESVARLRGEQLTLGYGKYTVAENLTVEIPDGPFPQCNQMAGVTTGLIKIV